MSAPTPMFFTPAVRAAMLAAAVSAAMFAAVFTAPPALAQQAEPGTGAETEAEAADTSAVVIMYHRFGDSRHPTTNTTLEQLESHIAELQSGGYTVLPLGEIIRRQRAGEALADRTVGLSVDDAFTSVYETGWPRLRAAGLPFTLFVSTAAIGRTPGYATWDQIREMRDAGVEIGGQSHTHPHMAALTREAAGGELAESNAVFARELGAAPKLFAYPYGEAGLETFAAVKAAGFKAAFGQHSGALDETSNPYYLPRFAMNETYGDIQRFRTAVNALALRVSGVTPEDPLIGAVNPPNMGFTVLHREDDLKRLACYASHEGRAAVEVLGGARIEVRFTKAFPAGRTRINCTLPAGPADGGRWHWFGRQYYLAP
ncbi:MAG: polysaccharide deacetylase family protein [Rhodospirillales bacterium]